MKYAYYLAADGSFHGDADYQRGLRELYEAAGVDKPGPYSGASRYDRPDGSVAEVVVTRNIFSDNPTSVGRIYNEVPPQEAR